MDEAAGPSTSRTSNLEDVDDEMSLADEDEEHAKALKAKEMMLPLFQKYNFTLKPNKLPIRHTKDDILSRIRENPVVVLEGPTGCGKTTQVPQFILEEAYQRKEYCNIIVTQPRKIAAMSIAKRVSEERKCELGSLVGFKVGLKECISPDTRLLYCTTGVLLQSLINSKSMANYTHVILDEIHEREVDMDFLLIVVRRFLATNSSKTKIILMSATIDSKSFAEYFKTPKKVGYLTAPIISVDRPRLFNVKEFYYDDLDKLRTDFAIDYENPGISSHMYTVAAKLVLVCDRLIENIHGEERMEYKPTVLIFLPGINEIDRMDRVLRETLSRIANPSEKPNLDIHRLHSILPADEQVSVIAYLANCYYWLHIRSKIHSRSKLSWSSAIDIHHCEVVIIALNRIVTYPKLSEIVRTIPKFIIYIYSFSDALYYILLVHPRSTVVQAVLEFSTFSRILL